MSLLHVLGAQLYVAYISKPRSCCLEEDSPFSRDTFCMDKSQRQAGIIFWFLSRVSRSCSCATSLSADQSTGFTTSTACIAVVPELHSTRSRYSLPSFLLEDLQRRSPSASPATAPLALAPDLCSVCYSFRVVLAPLFSTLFSAARSKADKYLASLPSVAPASLGTGPRGGMFDMFGGGSSPGGVGAGEPGAGAMGGGGMPGLMDMMGAGMGGGLGGAAGGGAEGMSGLMGMLMGGGAGAKGGLGGGPDGADPKQMLKMAKKMSKVSIYFLCDGKRSLRECGSCAIFFVAVGR